MGDDRRWGSALRAAAGLLSVTLAACGGGGGGSGGAPTGRFSIAHPDVTVSALSTDLAPVGDVFIAIERSGTGPLYVLFDGPALVGIDTFDATGTAVSGLIGIHFKSPAALGPGTYDDTFTLRLCFDQACRQPLDGGPVTIRTHYTVIAQPRVSLAVPGVGTGALAGTAVGPTVAVPIDSRDLPGAGVYMHVDATASGLARVDVPAGPVSAPQVSLVFKSPQAVGVGVYIDTLSIAVCFDAACTQPVPGSPLALRAAYTVDYPAAQILNQQGLHHDVVDAKYSAALNAVVTVSGRPSNALYLFDLPFGPEHVLPLGSAPTAVDVGPDGHAVAVGHDGSISYLADLALLRQPGSPSATTLAVAATVGDLALDGQGRVHVVPAGSGAVTLHSVDLATGAESTSGGGAALRAGSRATLRPGTTRLYAADRDGPPGGATAWDVSVPAAQFLWALSGTAHPICGDLWFLADAARAASPCGGVFAAGATQGTDLAYVGTLPTDAFTNAAEFVSVDSSAAANEIVAVEQDPVECGPGGQPLRCRTAVATHDAATLARTALWGLPDLLDPFNGTFTQRGVYVFYGSDGRRWLISRAVGATDPTATYYLGQF